DAARALQHMALAAGHVAMMRHHPPGPWRRCVETFEISRRGERLVAFQLVELEAAFASRRARPARRAAKARDAQPFAEMLVRVPILELPPHLGRDVPEHGERRLSEQSHGVLPSSPSGLP